MTRLRGVSAIAAVVAVMGLVTACGDGERKGQVAASDQDKDQAAARPGSPIVDGLTVPEGAWLAGGLFWEPAIPNLVTAPETATTGPIAPSNSTNNSDEERQAAPDTEATSTTPDSWHAILVIDGDVFEVYDAVAAQIRDRLGAPLAGTADSCAWRFAKGEGPPVIREPPPTAIEGVDCFAVASDEQNHQTVYKLLLTWRSQGTPSLEVSRSTLNAENDGKSRSLVPTLESQEANTGAATMREPGPGQVQAEASALLPEIPVPPKVGVGDEFGQGANCFKDGATSRFRLPPGARLVADEVGDGSISILAVDDRDAALDELETQFEPVGIDGAVLDELKLQSGETIVRLSRGVSAGGGYCEALSTPDGKFLQIRYHSD